MDITGRRVLILVENLSVPFDRRVWREALSLRQAGCRVTVVCPRGQGRDAARRETLNGVEIRRFALRESRSYGVLSYAREYLAALSSLFAAAFAVRLRHRLDVIQICNPPDLLFLVALPLKLLGAKVVFDHHDLSPELFVSRGGPANRFLVRLLLLCERATFAVADRVLSTNESFGAIATGRGRKRPAHVYVVRNGPLLTDLDAARADARPRLSGGRRFLIVYVGMMGRQDGVSLLLHAVRDLCLRRERDFRLALFGDGPELGRLRALAGALGVDGVVDFHGRVAFDEILSAIAAADLCVCPDPKTPMNDLSTLVKVTEYLGVGRPVVAFDLRETRRTAGDAAVYAEPNSVPSFTAAMDRLLEDGELRRTLGERGRRRARARLTWDFSQRELLRAYGSLFGGAA